MSHIETPAAEASPQSDGNEPAAEEPPKATEVAPRDDWFLRQYEARGTDTYHKPEAIGEKWNSLTKEERAKICPACSNTVTITTVVKSIQRAKAVMAAKAALIRALDAAEQVTIPYDPVVVRRIGERMNRQWQEALRLKKDLQARLYCAIFPWWVTEAAKDVDRAMSRGDKERRPARRPRSPSRSTRRESPSPTTARGSRRARSPRSSTSRCG